LLKKVSFRLKLAKLTWQTYEENKPDDPGDTEEVKRRSPTVKVMQKISGNCVGRYVANLCDETSCTINP
jgi:hypothetical protein